MDPQRGFRRNVIDIVFVLIVFGFFSFQVEEGVCQDLSKEHCRQDYEDNGACPEDLCELGCFNGVHGDSCQKECRPRPCIEIPVDKCPLERCDILEGCNQEKVCYYKIPTPQGDCGGLAYQGQSLSCCEGFVKRCGIEFFDGSCDMTGKFSIYSISMCLPCGNGICNQFENRCNCPEDCQ